MHGISALLSNQYSINRHTLRNTKCSVGPDTIQYLNLIANAVIEIPDILRRTVLLTCYRRKYCLSDVRRAMSNNEFLQGTSILIEVPWFLVRILETHCWLRV